MDFTIKQYTQLLKSLQSAGFFFQTFTEFLQNPKEKTVILRHDVDRLPKNSLLLATIENDFGIKASYYFRAVPESLDEIIIKEISALGHEIGYHYENLTTCSGNIELAIKDFKLNLEKFRKLVPISTICMHGSPMSKYDSKDLWKHYSYKDFGIIGEPYFDVDFSSVFYLTDTGRKWNNQTSSVRDNVSSGFNLKIENTKQIIYLAENNQLPDKIMTNIHPHRWFELGFNWYKELILQNIKNIVKYILIKYRNCE